MSRDPGEFFFTSRGVVYPVPSGEPSQNEPEAAPPVPMEDWLADLERRVSELEYQRELDAERQAGDDW